MPRNASGTYTLAQSAFQTQTTISSSNMNSDLSDIATALTQSIASTGVTPITGPLLGASGSVAAPSYTFNSNQATGFWLAGSNQIGWSANGVQGATFNSDKTVTWAGAHTFQATISVTGASTLTGTVTMGGAATVATTLGVTGASTLTGNVSCGGTLSVTGTSTLTGDVTMSATDQFFPAKGTTAQRAGSPTEGAVRYNSTLHGLEFWNGTFWCTAAQAPTIQSFTSGAAQTYTPTTGTVRIRVRMVGGGGGGGAANTNSGTNGGDTSFGSWTALHGVAGAHGDQGAGGAGGTGGATGTGNLIVRLTGASGETGIFQVGGGMGGSSPFGGAGACNGIAAAANTGSGGGGGVSGNNAAGGGGAGEYLEFWVTNPGATSYTVGTAGSGGAAGGTAGGNGAAGIIIIEEFYL